MALTTSDWLESLFALRCPGCGEALRQATLCASCQKALVPRHLPHFVYLGNYQRFGVLSRKVKYQGHRLLAELLGQKIALGVRQAEWCLDGVTAVPTLAHRRLARGYNQSELLAQAAAKALGVPYRPVLARATLGKSQTEKTLLGRLELSGDAFRPAARAKGIWLLVDDVVTTGTTYDRARKALFEAGAAKVYGAAIAVKSPHDLAQYSL